MTTPGIPNDYCISTTCFGSRLPNIQDQVFAAVGMGFRRLELGLAERPPSMDGLEESQRETGVTIPSLVAGCRDPLNGSMAVERLGSLVKEECERGINSLRRHVRLAQAWGCRIVVVRGTKVEDAKLQQAARELHERRERNGLTQEIKEEANNLAGRVHHKAQRQIEQFCRSLHALAREYPDTTFAVEPGGDLADLLGFEAMGWVLSDLESIGLCYWHDVGRIHQREKLGLEAQGEWLDAYASRMVGTHLQDATEEQASLPIGLGDVDFRLLAEYVPKEAEKVLEIGPHHGRAEILTSVRFLLDRGF